MPALKVKSMITCGILLIFMIVVVQYIVHITHLTSLSNVLNLKPSEEPFNISRRKLLGLQILDPVQFDSQSDVMCINTTIATVVFPMCVYNPADDIYITRSIVAGNFFENELVEKVLIFLRMNPDVTFVDLGANLGAYSLPIAHSGIHVVSVEPNKDSVRRLAKSVHLGRIENNNIDIFHYALSNEESTTFLKFDAVNRGNTYMAGDGPCPGCLSANVTILNKLIPFIRHKKALIKVDTQEAEMKIFQRKSASKFFDETDVVMIQMAWTLYPINYGKTEEGRRRIDRFLEFFYLRGYEVYDPRTEQKLDANWTQWGYDVLFKKDDLPKNQLFLI